jgi:hypothetical protein
MKEDTLDKTMLYHNTQMVWTLAFLDKLKFPRTLRPQTEEWCKSNTPGDLLISCFHYLSLLCPDLSENRHSHQRRLTTITQLTLYFLDTTPFP